MRVTRIFEDLGSSDPLPGDGTLDQPTFVSLLARHKALILRSDADKPPMSVDDFGNLVSGLGLKRYPYVGGAAPRRTIPVSAGDDLVYTANEAPPDQKIPFHHELAQVRGLCQCTAAGLFHNCGISSECLTPA